MKGTRHQEGFLYRKGSLWLLRYYDSEFAAGGFVRRVQKTKKLAAVGPECKNKTAARDLATEFLESINLARNTPESAMTLIRLTEDRCLPFVEEHKRISTFRGYRNMWRRYLKPRCDIMLREFRTVEGERILDSIAKDHNHLYDIGPHQGIPLRSVSICQTSRGDQFRKPDTGHGLAQR
jgi:hypothetical protein